MAAQVSGFMFFLTPDCILSGVSVLFEPRAPFFFFDGSRRHSGAAEHQRCFPYSQLADEVLVWNQSFPFPSLSSTLAAEAVDLDFGLSEILIGRFLLPWRFLLPP